jgi:hypothetical protein
LVELDAAEPDLFVRLLERCTHISLEYIADNGGLYEVLSAGEMVDTDVAAEREDRRTTQGYVAPSAAKAFLAHARVEPLPLLLANEAADPITHAYYRDTSPSRAASHEASRDSSLTHPRARFATSLASADKASVHALIETLQAIEVLPNMTPTPLLSAGGEGERSQDPLIVRAVRELLPLHAEAHAARVDELAYLANVVLAGCSTSLDELRGTEAARAVFAICDRGVATLFAKIRPHERGGAAATWLRDHSLVNLFRIGWHELSARASTGQSDPELVRAVVTKLESAPVRRQKPSRLSSRRGN